MTVLRYEKKTQNSLSTVSQNFGQHIRSKEKLISHMVSESSDGISFRYLVRTRQCQQSDLTMIKLYNYYLLSI